MTNVGLSNEELQDMLLYAATKRLQTSRRKDLPQWVTFIQLLVDEVRWLQGDKLALIQVNADAVDDADRLAEVLESMPSTTTTKVEPWTKWFTKRDAALAEHGKLTETTK